jgi:D-3-phosphoglycerate dehydrogenase
MTMPTVLLTNPIHAQAQQTLAAFADVVVAPDNQPSTLRKLVTACDALMVRCHLPSDIFEAAPRLKYVIRHGVGLDMVPVQAATQRGIVVANLPGSNTHAVVEYVLACMMALRRNVLAMDQALRDQGWDTAKPLSNNCIEWAGATLGVVGYGSIGQGISKIATAMGMSVCAYTRRPETVEPPVTALTWPALLQAADLIVLACPHTEQTHHLVNAQALAQVKPTAILINVARGPVVDTHALIHALNRRQLAGAALDVHESTPLTGHEPIFECPNVILTPHLAGNTASSLAQMSQWAVQTLVDLMAGKRPAHVVNPQVFLGDRGV